MTPSALIAPAIFAGIQWAPDPMPPIELWTLTEAVRHHPVGSTLSRATLESYGYVVDSEAAR